MMGTYFNLLNHICKGLPSHLRFNFLVPESRLNLLDFFEHGSGNKHVSICWFTCAVHALEFGLLCYNQFAQLLKAGMKMLLGEFSICDGFKGYELLRTEIYWESETLWLKTRLIPEVAL